MLMHLLHALFSLFVFHIRDADSLFEVSDRRQVESVKQKRPCSQGQSGKQSGSDCAFTSIHGVFPFGEATGGGAFNAGAVGAIRSPRAFSSAFCLCSIRACAFAGSFA